MAEGCKSGFIAVVVAGEWKEWIDVFSLVVCPDCRVVRLSTGAMQRTSLRVINTLAGPHLGEVHHFIDDRIGGFKHKRRH